MNMSHARIHAMILKHLYFSHHEVASIGVGHDTTLFLPKEDTQGRPRYYYSFDGHDIPLVPLTKDKEPAIMVYEILKVFRPEMIISIGDFNDHLYMKAVKMFSEVQLKWISVLANYSYPINEHKQEVVEDMDGILCTNSRSFDMLCNLFKKDEICLSHVGCNKPIIKKPYPRRSPYKFRIMSCGKNLQSDNLPMLMEVCAGLRETIPNLELYLHSNVYDRGDYDLNLVKERFDPDSEFIVFPQKYVSLTDGYSEEEYAQELAASDVFVSVSLNSSSALSVFEALAYDCWPVMTDAGSHRDVAAMIEEISPEFQRNDFLVPGIKVMTTGEVYVNICRPDLLGEKILEVHGKIKKGGHRTFSQEFISSHNRKTFLTDVMELIEAVKRTNSTICVEPV
jgi:hypothetical protein